MAAADIDLSAEAYSTIVLHCAKHPAAAITGLLLGPSSSNGKGRAVTGALPLQHHWNQLSPMVEVGCSLAQAHAASLHTPLDVVGVYFAPSDVASSQRAELHAIATKIAQTIASRLGVDAIALQINNAKLASKTEHSLVAFRVGQGYSSSAKALPASAVQLADSGNALSRTRASVARGDWKRVVDFDDHLEDTSLDWLSASA